MRSLVIVFLTAMTVLFGMFIPNRTPASADAASFSWVSSAAPLPGNQYGGQLSDISGISCGGAGSCVAVGEYEGIDSSVLQLPFIDSLTDGSWAATEPPIPSNAEQNQPAF